MSDRKPENTVETLTSTARSNSSDMNEDELLQHLALEAQRYPAHSKERSQALAQLCEIVLQSNRLYRPRAVSRVVSFQGADDEIWQVAVQELMVYMCDRIDDYRPKRASVMTWLNFLLSRRFYTMALNQFQNPKEQRVPKRTLSDLDADPIEKLPANEPNENIQQSNDVRQLIETDPKGVFKAAHVEGYPEASFQFIAINKFFEGRSWQELSDQIGVPIPTLSSFYRRHLNKFIPLIRELLL